MESSHDVMHSRSSDSITKLKSVIQKWLSNYPEQVAQPQFTLLIKQCAPFMTDPKITELFRSIDLDSRGSVHKSMLLQNDYLANVICVRLSRSQITLVHP